MNNDIFQKLGGRKFLLTLAAMAAIITIAIKSPTALTTELIVGILGAIATYSGSNAFLTGLGMKASAKKEESIETVINPPERINTESSADSDKEQRLYYLEQRMDQNEATTKEIIEIIKQLMNKNNQK